MRGEDYGNTLCATALVHEAYLKLAGGSSSFENRVHFFAVAARVMRRILVDHARTCHAQKRGGNGVQVDLNQAAMVSPDASPMLLALDRALDELQVLDARK